jgi:predicted phosphoribosyltransferase
VERLFEDRRQAGRVLGEEVARLELNDPIVLGLPRGGVVVAAEVADALGCELDVLVVRKIGAPFQPELALGAIAEGGVKIFNRELMRQLRQSEDDLAATVEREQAELERRVAAYRQEKDRPDIEGRDVVVVDDGLATGATAQAAGQVVTAMGAGRVVLAVPVGSPDTVKRLSEYFDEVVCPVTPSMFMAIGQFYRDFRQVEDDEVVRLLS